jgi:hypothetical protein
MRWPDLFSGFTRSGWCFGFGQLPGPGFWAWLYQAAFMDQGGREAGRPQRTSAPQCLEGMREDVLPGIG